MIALPVQSAKAPPDADRITPYSNVNTLSVIRGVDRRYGYCIQREKLGVTERGWQLTVTPEQLLHYKQSMYIHSMTTGRPLLSATTKPIEPDLSQARKFSVISIVPCYPFSSRFPSSGYLILLSVIGFPALIDQLRLPIFVPFHFGRK